MLSDALTRGEEAMVSNLIIKIVLISAFLLPAVFDGSAFAEEKKAPRTSMAKRPRAVFDAGHNEVFSPVKDGPVHYSAFRGMFVKNGFEAVLLDAPVTPEGLSRADIYIIAGPMQGFTQDEISALKAYVENGGSLLVMLHISSPVAALLPSFGVTVSNYVLGERENTIKGAAQDFYLTDLTDHPINAGVKKIAVFGAWGLLAEGRAKATAHTSAWAWFDANRNRQYDHNEPRQSFAVSAVCECGKGRVVVIGDDAPFANGFIKEAGNTRLAQNVIKWLKR